MESSTGQIGIYCVKPDAEYTLRFGGADWAETVSSIEEGIRRAGQLVVEETKVMVYDATGHGLLVATLRPLPGTVDAPPWISAPRGKIPETNLPELRKRLATEGLRGAVQFLNSLTPHRFTSLYRFDGPTLRNVTFFDRDNPDVESSEDIPIEASFCVFVRDTRCAFTIADAGSDDRVRDHPKRAVVKRYCGVPLLDSAGRMFGSICHFDFEPGRVDESEVALLERMAELLRPSFAN
jgi:hypothetical protein